jgi:hypothetical protein
MPVPAMPAPAVVEQFRTVAPHAYRPALEAMLEGFAWLQLTYDRQCALLPLRPPLWPRQRRTVATTASQALAAFTGEIAQWVAGPERRFAELRFDDDDAQQLHQAVWGYLRLAIEANLLTLAIRALALQGKASLPEVTATYRAALQDDQLNAIGYLIGLLCALARIRPDLLDALDLPESLIRSICTAWVRAMGSADALRADSGDLQRRFPAIVPLLA